MVKGYFLMIVVALSVSHGLGLPMFDNLPELQEDCAGNMCVVAGDPHFTTFDCVRYEYHGHCDYTLVKTCGSDGNDVENESFEVIGQFERLRYNPKVSVVKSISIHIANSVVRLDETFSVFIDGEKVSDETTNRQWGVINQYKNAVVVGLINGLTIYWCSPYKAMFSVDPKLTLQLCGLCGSNNANKSDEFESMREEQLGDGVVSFGDAWRTNPEKCGPCNDCTDTVCQINQDNHERAQELCQVFTNGALPDCQKDLDHQATYDRCMADMCAFLPELTKLCSLVYDYAATCLDSGAGFVDIDALGVCGFFEENSLIGGPPSIPDTLVYLAQCALQYSEVDKPIENRCQEIAIGRIEKPVGTYILCQEKGKYTRINRACDGISPNCTSITRRPIYK